ncbi:MAG TPA: molybdopterin-dependent oxidoreductase [Acidimicrobiales bacterium]|nr:molybdopterin-dependent oxidoreductase [Acidimicrobiales bacterium]
MTRRPKRAAAPYNWDMGKFATPAPGASPDPDGRAETPAGTPIGRRVVLGMLGLGAVGIVTGSWIQDKISRTLAPLQAADPTGLTSLIPAGGGFRIYSVTGSLPHRSDADYRLQVNGLVDHPLNLTLADLQAMPPTSLTKDFQCVTGWRVPQVPWTGVALAAVLDAAGVQTGARALRFESFDGAYTESLTLAQGRRPDVIVAYEMEGKPVTAAHGGPVRMYVAPMYGYKSCKWLSRITVVDHVEPGYWEQLGYDVDGWVGKSNGRSDTPTS